VLTTSPGFSVRVVDDDVDVDVDVDGGVKLGTVKADLDVGANDETNDERSGTAGRRFGEPDTTNGPGPVSGESDEFGVVEPDVDGLVGSDGGEVESVGAADATPCPVATAAPTPRATANPPTRPI